MAETANVEILINAFTDAAEEALDDVSDQLLDLSVSGQPAQSIMDEVADELDDATTSAVAMGAAFEAADGKVNGLTAAMALLANRADEAGDEIRFDAEVPTWDTTVIYTDTQGDTAELPVVECYNEDVTLGGSREEWIGFDLDFTGKTIEGAHAASSTAGSAP